MSLFTTIPTSTYAYELLIAAIDEGYLAAEYYDEVTEGLGAAYTSGVAVSVSNAVRGAYLDMFEAHPVATERILDLLCEGEYLAVEFTARRYLRLDAGRALTFVAPTSMAEEPMFPRLAGSQGPTARLSSALCPAA